MRKYRLYWFVTGLIALAGLFIWKNSSSLAPRYVEQEREDFVAGKEAASGFVNLLRRNIPQARCSTLVLLNGKNPRRKAAKYSKSRIEQAELRFAMEKSLSANERNSLAAYQEISKT